MEIQLLVLQTDSWYDAYIKPNSLLLIKVNGTIYAIKKDGQWELTDETATIDTETHHVLMSITPLAGK